MSRRFLSVEEEKQLVQEYLDGTSVQVLCAKYGYKTKQSIMNKVRKHHPNPEEAIKQARQNRKKWSYDISEIRNNFDAYFVGLMLTDGYISTRGTDAGIDLIDEDAIALISKVTGKEYKKYEYSDTDKAFGKYERKDRFRIILSGKDIVEQLARYGVVQKKTHTLSGFTLKEEEYKFIPYLIRGIIDGDGCVFQTSYGSPAFYIISASKAFIQWCKQLLENHLYLSQVSITKSKEGLYKLSTAAQDDILKLITLVYEKPFGMARKRDKLIEMFRDYNSDLLLQQDMG